MEQETKYNIYQKVYNAWQTDPQITNLSYPEVKTDYIFTCNVGDMDIEFKLFNSQDMLLLTGIKKCPGKSDQELKEIGEGLVDGSAIQLTYYDETLFFKEYLVFANTNSEVAERTVLEGAKKFLAFAKKAGTVIVSSHSKTQSAGSLKQNKAAENQKSYQSSSFKTNTADGSSNRRSMPADKKPDKPKIDYSAVMGMMSDTNTGSSQKKAEKPHNKPQLKEKPDGTDYHKNHSAVQKPEAESKPKERAIDYSAINTTPNQVSDTDNNKPSERFPSGSKQADIKEEKQRDNLSPETKVPSNQNEQKPNTSQQKPEPEPIKEEKTSAHISDTREQTGNDTIEANSSRNNNSGKNFRTPHNTDVPSETSVSKNQSISEARVEQKAYDPAVAMQMREMLADMDKIFKRRKETAEYQEDTLNKREAIFNESMSKRENDLKHREEKIQKDLATLEAKQAQQDIVEHKFQAKVQQLSMREQTVELKEKNLTERENYINSLEGEKIQITAADTHEYTEQIAKLNAAVDQYRNRVQEYESQIQDLKDQLGQSTSIIQKLQQQNESLSESDTSTLQDQLAEMEDRLQNMRFEKGQAENELVTIQKRFDDISQRNKGLENAYAKLQAENTSLHESLTLLQESTAGSSDYETRIADLQKSLETEKNANNVYRTKEASFSAETIKEALNALEEDPEEDEDGNMFGYHNDIEYYISPQYHCIRMEKNIRRGSKHRQWAKDINDRMADSCVLTDKHVIYKVIFDNFREEFAEMLEELEEL